MRARTVVLQIATAFGALVGYGCLIAFLWLVSLQTYRWFRDGEWTHFGVSEGMRVGLARCCGQDLDGGRLAAISHWLDSPANWVGLHRVLELVPASLALFLVSMAGNCLFIYGRDRLHRPA